MSDEPLEEIEHLRAALHDHIEMDRQNNAKIEQLENAIRKHRDYRGDDRCWMDDQELYDVLVEPIPDPVLPPPDEMLANCKRYIECRHTPGAVYVSPQATIDKLRLEASVWRRLVVATDDYETGLLDQPQLSMFIKAKRLAEGSDDFTAASKLLDEAGYKDESDEM